MMSPGEKYLELLKAAFPVDRANQPESTVEPSFWFSGLRGYLDLVQVDVLEVEVNGPVPWTIRVSAADIGIRSKDETFVLGFDSGVAIFNGTPCTLDYLHKIAGDIDALILADGSDVTCIFFSKGKTRMQAEMTDWPFASQILRLTGSALTDYSNQIGELRTHDVQSVEADLIKRDRLWASLTLVMACFRPKLNEEAPMPIPQILEFERATNEAWETDGNGDARALPSAVGGGWRSEEDFFAEEREENETETSVVEEPVAVDPEANPFSEFNPILDMLAIPTTSRQSEMVWVDEHGNQRYMDSESTKFLNKAIFEKKRYRSPITVDWPEMTG